MNFFSSSPAFHGLVCIVFPSRMKWDLGVTLEPSLQSRSSGHNNNNKKKKKRPILIYLHGNCGCRVDAIECLEGALKNDMTVLGVDLSGSGHSEGEYITLGWNEKEDVWDLIRYMKAKGTVSSVCLWGRSMGMMYQIDFFFLLLTLKQQQQQQQQVL